MKTETATANNLNSFSFASSSNGKYGGILIKSPLKILRKEIADLISYVYSVSPSFTALNYVITVLRIFQLVGPSLNPGYLSFWNKDYVTSRLIFFLSILFFIIPPESHPQASFPTMIVFIIIQLLIVVLLVGSAKYFKKKASLPSIIPPIISFYFASFGFCLPSIAIEIIFSQISNYIFSDDITDDVSRTIIILAFSIIVTAAYLYIFFAIALQVLTFQPTSLMAVMTMPQILIMGATMGMTFIIAITEFADRTPTIIFCVITALLYFGSISIIFCKGGLVRQFDSVLFFGACGAGGVTSLIIAIYSILDKNGSLEIIGIFFALILLFTLLGNYIINRTKLARLQILDKIQDEAQNFNSLVKSENHFLNIAVTGFSQNHPLCLNWEFFRLGIERWPKNGEVWFIYAKFVVIYPEETQTLGWIFRSIVTNHVKGTAAKTVKDQSLSIVRQRESNLSMDLKMKMNSITKHITNSKHKLRNVWDLAIQGNITDMEVATKRAISDIVESEGDLKHIIRLFPNNRFITRQYARFSRELMADHKTCIEMIDKTRLLHRNINVNKDQTHEYGMSAFPSLPEKSYQSHNNEIHLSQNNDTFNSSTTELEDQDQEIQDRDETSTFLVMIDKLKIPSTTWLAFLVLFIFLILYLLPGIAILIYIPSFIEKISSPLEFMYDLSMARTLTYSIVTFEEQVMWEHFGLYIPPYMIGDKPPESFGSTMDSVDQLAFVCKQMAATMQYVEEFRAYKETNNEIIEGKDIVFGSNLNFSYFNGIVPNRKMVSVQAAVADILTQQVIWITRQPIPNDVVNSSVLLNAVDGMNLVAGALEDALGHLVQFIADTDKRYVNIFKIVMFSAFCLYAAVNIVMIIISVIWVQSNKNEVYRCLTSLPKNAVSSLAENLRVLKKETENSSTATGNSTETNKQEDNILKIFMTGGTNGSNSHDSFYITACYIIAMVLYIISAYFLGTMMIDISNNLRQNSPHMNYLQGIYANIMAATSAVNLLIGFCDDRTDISSLQKSDLLNRMELRLVRTRNYYHMAKFGGELVEEPPFSGYAEGVIEADKQFVCHNPLQITDNLLQAAKCYTADDIIVLLEAVYLSRKVPYELDPENFPYLENDVNFRTLWSLLLYPIYDLFIGPMSEKIIDTITSDLDDIFYSRMITVVILMVLAFVETVILLVIIYSIDHHIKSVLKLLLHCPPKVLATTIKVMAVLDGDFRPNRGDFGTRSAKFFTDVCNDLPNGIIVIGSDKVVSIHNKSLNRIFGPMADNIIGKPITNLINHDNFPTGNLEDLINGQPQKVATETLTFKKEDDGVNMNVEAVSIMINNNVIIEFRDITQTVRYNKLINDEKQKSDNLLSAILPPSLVVRVQNGEKNISFAVHSATIVFMDIVSFTPWCGSLPAEKVMSTLNKLFMKNDNLVAKYPTMTKIKCIGDCYMAAGGVFSEVNQPAVHAKEVVNFGLDSLDAINDLNQELNEKLQIRVGINTGGPIVAGVLGIGKPTFEILGPAINMAQQMEHHGVPMKVHVSRPVYEYIYGDQFDIKERGQIEVKNGKVVTYLVDRK